MNNMKRITVLACACIAALAVFARPGPGPRGGFRPPPPRHHHHHHHGAAVGAGILGAGILGAAIIDAATRPDTVIVQQPTVVAPAPVVTPAPVVVTQPAVVAAPTVVSTGHYETRVQNVWVEGRYIDQMTANGTAIRTWQPGHYEQQTTQVWVP